MRIWHQSFTDLSQFPAYRARLEAHAATGSPSDVEVDIHGLAAGTYPDGVAPMAANSYPYLKRLHEAQVIEAAMSADEQGYDAFALGCFFDPGLREARSVARIPVVGLAETCMLVACSLGRRFGVVSLTDFQRDLSVDLAAQYGLASRLAGAVTMEPGVTLFDLEVPDSRDVVFRGFQDACEKLTSAGAEVIIPGDGVLNEFLIDHRLREVAGAVVIDSLSVLFHHAAFLAGLREATGAMTSRAGYYARPPSDLLLHARASGSEPFRWT